MLRKGERKLSTALFSGAVIGRLDACYLDCFLSWTRRAECSGRGGTLPR
jgi:hypothetical protein